MPSSQLEVWPIKTESTLTISVENKLFINLFIVYF